VNASASRDQQFRDTAALVREVYAAEHRWLRQGDPCSPVNPWMPFQPGEFLSILFECVTVMTGREFLDVGCGPGTKMQLARHFLSLEPCGIEINPVMAEAAEEHGEVVNGDALKVFPGVYEGFDLVWMYRPFRDPELERKLEARVTGEMKPGAVLAGGSWETCPADLGWLPVVDDWELRRGAWMKPHPVITL
jgi:SAM-dependent methyltransferase